MAMVPINHTDRGAIDVFVDEHWAGDVDKHQGGGAAACCYPGLNDWRQPVTIRWTWGDGSKETERQAVVTHFPASGPHDDPDPLKSDAYVCVILRDLNTAELAFSPSASGCAHK
jgi:hypothetical protein